VPRQPETLGIVETQLPQQAAQTQPKENLALTNYTNSLKEEDAEYTEANMNKFTELFSMGFDNHFLNMCLMKKF